MTLVFGKTGAQGVFAYQAGVDSVRADGFYQILLTPELVAKCKPDLSDVRILGPGNRFVSYVLKDSWAGKTGEAEWMTIPGAVLTQKDSVNRHTYIFLQFPEAYEIDRLAFMIRDPAFYRREAQVSAEGVHPGEWIGATGITLLPGAPMARLPAFRTRRLRIDIDNADNAPLSITEVGCFQLSHCLLAYMKAGVDYRIVAGDARAAVPDYDLKYFTDSLKTAPPKLHLGPVRQTAVVNTDKGKQLTAKGVKGAGKGVPGAGNPGGGDGGHSGVLLWSILLLVLLLLLYLSLKLARATAQKDAKDRL
jgi:hypothetical protein